MIIETLLTTTCDEDSLIASKLVTCTLVDSFRGNISVPQHSCYSELGIEHEHHDNSTENEEYTLMMIQLLGLMLMKQYVDTGLWEVDKYCNIQTKF